MSASVRVALADDHALFRQGVRLLLALQPGIEVVDVALYAVRVGLVDSDQRSD